MIIYDAVINGGTVIDVVGGHMYQANIGIRNGKIAKIARNALPGSIQEDAMGMIVAPGFIDFHSHVDGNEYSAECLVKQGGTTTLGGQRSLSSKTIKRVAQGFLINQGFSVSQSFVLRRAVGLTDPLKPASREQIDNMVLLAERFMECGAFSISFALELVPGTSSDELLGLARVARKYDRPILIHLRKDGREALQYFDEIFDVARQTGVKVHILELMYMVGIGGAMPAALKMIEEARKEGLDITADSGVYDAYCASIGTSIFDDGWENGYGDVSVRDLMISSGLYSGEWCTEELFKVLRKRYPQTLVSAFVCDTWAIPLALEKDFVYVSTNAADGPHYPGIGAPEVAGTFPRLLSRYVRQEKVLSLVDAVRKITILPAMRFGLQNVGVIEEGYDADLVIFNEKTIKDNANFLGFGQPDAEPDGIQSVFVNGIRVVSEGRLTGIHNAGRLLTK